MTDERDLANDYADLARLAAAVVAAYDTDYRSLALEEAVASLRALLTEHGVELT